MLKAGRAVNGVSPLAFAKGDPSERETWRWDGDSLTVKSSGVGTNDMTSVSVSSGRIFRRGEANSLYLDRDRKPVWVDFGARTEVPDGKFEYVSPAEWTRHPADSFEKSAEAIEKKVAAASVGVLLKLEAEEKEGRRSYFSFSSDDSNKNEIDAVGFAVGGRVIVPCDLGGEKIARLSKAEATFPDGTSTNLVFAGALAEWNAILFDVPEDFRAKLAPLEIAKGSADDFDNSVAWCVTVENENGRVVADARRRRFEGVEFLRGAVFVPRAAGGEEWSERRTRSFVLDADGRIASFALARRFKAERWSSSEKECVTTADLARFVAGEGVNPEFAPRREEDRNRLVWLGVETVQLTDALARERKAQSFMKEYSRPPYVTEVYAGSPAQASGIQVGDVLLAVRRGSEAERELESERDYSSRDWGAFFSSEYAIFGGTDSTPWPNVDLSVRDMTFEVRRFFKFDEKAPGVVIAKVKPGSPAAVAGLKPFELVTEVNGENVVDAKDFASKIKGRQDLVFAVRRLAQTRMVKIHVEPEAEKEKAK